MVMFNASNTVLMNYNSILFYATILFFIGIEIIIDMGTNVIKKRSFPSAPELIRRKILRELKGNNLYQHDIQIEINSPKSGIELIPRTERENKEESKDVSYSLKNYQEYKEYKETSVGLPIVDGSSILNMKTRSSDLRVKMEPSIGLQDQLDLPPVGEEEVHEDNDPAKPISQSTQLNPGPSSLEFKKKISKLRSDEDSLNQTSDKTMIVLKNKRGSIPRLNITKPPN